MTYLNYDERKHETDLAVLFHVDGEDLWIPKSVIEDEDENAQAVAVKTWWAEKNGIEGDW